MLQELPIQPAAPDNWPEAVVTIIVGLITWYIGWRDRRKRPRR